MSIERFEADLGRRVSARLAEEVGALEPLLGGHSGLTYRTSDGTLVIKAVPEGQRAIGRHDMVRQARIMKALRDSEVPVPGIVAVDESEPAWYAMEFVEGESLEPVLDDPAVESSLAAARMRRAAQILPGLHDVALDALPVDGPVLSPADELARWSRTMGAVPPELVPGGADLERQLAAAVPEAITPALVHGDYRLGNLISYGTEPVALIDWEIWAVGDPRVELGWFLVFADGANFPGVGREVPGLPDEDELIDLYVDRGRELPGMAWFNALGRFKMAAIMGHNLRRHREGRHHDPDQEKLPDTITALIRSGLERLE
jgi:aminoglycoside phosphotransferase (APT) family kinase protein